jgi:pyrimidine-nucleoside phosphorylase
MRAYDIILKKRDGGHLTSDEIGFIVRGCVSGEIPDSQMAAFLMAVYFQGMNAAETADLTMEMVGSGRTLDLSSIPGIKVDKHSTGGVGDKTTLVLIPLLAAAGVPVVKMSGRSLGHTGGTLDKLESVPGFSTSLSPEEMVAQVKRIGAAIAGQTADLVPADKKVYALRDITATVDCVPLIAASVMSKKIACGADAVVLDVKAGCGALVKTVPEAMRLARAMVEIGNQVGRKTVAAITDMEQPLGRAVGNALEVREAIETLKGNGPDDLVELCAVLGGIALVLGGKASSRKDGERFVRELLADGRGASKFREIIEAQGGNPSVLDDTSLLPTAPVVRRIPSPKSGYVTSLDALRIACAATALGAGRGSAGAKPDLTVGVYLHKKIGDRISQGEPLAETHARDDASAGEAESLVLGAYSFGEKPSPRPLIHEILE